VRASASDPSEIDAPGRVIVFYSFKGGTGRSMAVANVASLLARQVEDGRGVLVVDWDLEAPGLHRYFQPYLRRASSGISQVLDELPGLVDYFTLLRNRLDAHPPCSLNASDVAELVDSLPLADFIVETDIPNLSLMKAGRLGPKYAETVATFDWPGLYRAAPTLIRAFADRLASQYRYVLVDSRTGLTDTSGICTMLMPEILVAVFTPNRQSLSGVIDIVRQAAEYRANADDLRPLLVYPLPSRIEASEPDLRHSWRFGQAPLDLEGFEPAFTGLFREIYKLPACDLGEYFDDVQIQHVPRYAYGEEIAVLVENSRDRFSLTRSFERFTRRVASGLEPWSAPDSDADAAETERAGSAAVLGDTRDREIQASPYLQRLERELEALIRIAHRRHLQLRISNVLAIGTSFVVAVLVAFRWVSPVPNEIVLLLAVVAVVSVIAGTIFGRTAKRGWAAAQAADELQQEMEGFRASLPPYEGLEAPTTLIRRANKVLERARTNSDVAPPARRALGRRLQVYISYRYSDAATEAALLFQELRSLCPQHDVVIDFELLLGESVVETIALRAERIDVALVVIGPQWASPQMQAPDDLLTLEIAAMLNAGTRIIPVLVRQARMPSEGELPEKIKKVAQLNAFALNPSRMHADVLLLANKLELLGHSAISRPRIWM
jgi:MinD-like ATPase involved in chromosome partitioning or flagellar assembly